MLKSKRESLLLGYLSISRIMANKKTDMSKLRQMLRLYTQGESKLKISELTGVSRNTLKKYLKIYTRLGLSLWHFLH